MIILNSMGAFFFLVYAMLKTLETYRSGLVANLILATLSLGVGVFCVLNIARSLGNV